MANDNGKNEDSESGPVNPKDGNACTEKESSRQSLHAEVPLPSPNTLPTPSSPGGLEDTAPFVQPLPVCGEMSGTTAPAVAESSSSASSLGEMVEFKVIFNKQKYDVVFGIESTVGALKQHIHTITGVPAAMQKVMFKGLAKDEKTLRDLGVTKGAKIMVVGSTINDLMAVSALSKEEAKEEVAAASGKEPLCQQKLHRKIIDKGVPDDAMPGIKNTKESLPSVPLSGMVNKSGGKVRLTFKLEVDQLWIGTKERTDKIPMNSIKGVTSEPITGHEEYHIMGIQLGPTEASRYWIYWVPAQYVDAIKDAILGNWQYF